MTFEERCQQRKFLTDERFAVYNGAEHDLYLALPDYAKLQRCFTIFFDKLNILPVEIHFKNHKYILDSPPMLAEDRGYYCVQGKFKGSKGLHKIPLHRLAYTAFYGVPPTSYHIHHIDRNKHNNAADNLVALTEEEHCKVHGRDVRIQRNIFTKTKPKGLLTPKQKEVVAATSQKSELTDLLFSKFSAINMIKFKDRYEEYKAQHPEQKDTVLDILVQQLSKR